MVAQRHGFSAFGDNPPFPGMFEFQLLVSGASLTAARLVSEGKVGAAFNPAGGVNHHALPDQASGFGILNDAAIALAWLRDQGLRVAYVDIDVHQGDGVEAAFVGSDDVLTISLHESTLFLFPGPQGGFAEHIGNRGGPRLCSQRAVCTVYRRRNYGCGLSRRSCHRSWPPFGPILS